MIIRLDNPKLLSDAVAIISEIVKEVRIKLLEDGMSIVAVDPANVCLVIFKFPKSSFSKYETGNEVWGINLEDLKRVLRRAVSGSSVLFEQEDNLLKISIYDKVKRVFSIPLVDVSSDDKDIPNLNFSAEVEVDSETFCGAIEDALVVSDACSFIVGNNFFIIESEGNLSSARVEFSIDEAKINGFARAKYSLEYLSKFIKAGKLSERAVIRLSDDYPLRLDFPGEKMGIGFILAPRIESD